MSKKKKAVQVMNEKQAMFVSLKALHNTGAAATYEELEMYRREFPEYGELLDRIMYNQPWFKRAVVPGSHRWNSPEQLIREALQFRGRKP